MQINIKNSTWVPRQFVERSGKAHIEFVDFGGRELSESFLKLDLEKCQRSILVELDSLWQYELSSQELSENIQGMVFHMSRCGSSLVANMLRQDKSYQVISEADVLGQFLHSFRGSKQELVRHLRLIVSLLLIGFCKGNQKMIIKWTSWNAYIIDMICVAIPDVPLCYLYRDPGEVLVSLTQTLAEWQDPQLVEKKLTQPGISFAGSADSNPYIDLLLRSQADSALPEEMAARFIGECLVAISQSEKDIVMVPYQALPNAVFTVILPHFQIEMDGRTKSLARTESRWNTKAVNEKKLYSSDTKSKKKRITDKMQTLIDQYISENLTVLTRQSDALSVEGFAAGHAPVKHQNAEYIVNSGDKQKTDGSSAENTQVVVKWL